jgi:phosphoribosylglycinamide formyltransferase-1
VQPVFQTPDYMNTKNSSVNHIRSNKPQPHRLAICLSGGGSTAEAILEAAARGRLPGVEPVLVVSSDPVAGGVQKAQQRGVPVQVMPRSAHPSQKAYGAALLRLFTDHAITLISLNGWLPLMPAAVVDAYRGRIINQHPGPLDPERGHDFGGAGMFGQRVLAARIAYCWATRSDFWTEATVHHVTERFDEGRLISTTPVPLPSQLPSATVNLIHQTMPTDSSPQPATIIAALREHPVPLVNATTALHPTLQPVEHETVITALCRYGESSADGQSIPAVTRKKQLVPENHYGTLASVKQLAIRLFS